MFSNTRSFRETRRVVQSASSIRSRSTEVESFVVVGRQEVIESRFSSVICAPVYSAYHGLSSQVAVGVDDGLKHDSSIHCDELLNLPKSALTDYVGSLSPEKIVQLNRALVIAVGIIDDL